MTVTMEELSAGVQKIFRDAARPPVSFPMETEKSEHPPSDLDSDSTNITQHNITKTVHSEERERERENGFYKQPGGW